MAWEVHRLWQADLEDILDMLRLLVSEVVMVEEGEVSKILLRPEDTMPTTDDAAVDSVEKLESSTIQCSNPPLQQ